MVIIRCSCLVELFNHIHVLSSNSSPSQNYSAGDLSSPSVHCFFHHQVAGTKKAHTTQHYRKHHYRFHRFMELNS